MHARFISRKSKKPCAPMRRMIPTERRPSEQHELERGHEKNGGVEASEGDRGNGDIPVRSLVATYGRGHDQADFVVMMGGK